MRRMLPLLLALALCAGCSAAAPARQTDPVPRNSYDPDAFAVSGGYLTYDSSALEYRVEMDVSRDGNNLSFGKLGNRISTKVIDPFFDCASEDLFFAVEDVD